MFLKKLAKFFISLVEGVKGKIFSWPKNKGGQEKTKEGHEKSSGERIFPATESDFIDESVNPSAYWVEKNVSTPPGDWLEKVSHIPPERWEGTGKAIVRYAPSSKFPNRSVSPNKNTISAPNSFSLPRSGEFLEEQGSRSASWLRYLRKKIPFLTFASFSKESEFPLRRAKGPLGLKEKMEKFPKTPVALDQEMQEKVVNKKNADFPESGTPQNFESLMGNDVTSHRQANDGPKNIEKETQSIKRRMKRKSTETVKSEFPDFRHVHSGNSSGTPTKTEGKEHEKGLAQVGDQSPSRRHIEQTQFSINNFDAGESFPNERPNYDHSLDTEVPNFLEKGNDYFPWDSSISQSKKMMKLDPSKESPPWERSNFSGMEDDFVENFVRHSWPGLPSDSPDPIGEHVMLLQREFMHLRDLDREQGGHFWKE